ncbi:MAG: hypothetical protein Q8P18_15890 [Pseudomonadota bacterium]|nr:hypothetical protein [Pseudomonadota bacterium]
MLSLSALLLSACVLDWDDLFGDTAGPVDSDTADTADSGAPTGVTAGTRGVWAWRDSGDPNGTDAVVGDIAAEEAMVNTLIDWGVDRVYGAYGDRATTEPAVIAAWNTRLHTAGIESHVLVGEAAWISSREWSGMQEKIDERLVFFNAGTSDPAEAFDGLHLDIEPQGASDWSTISDTDRALRLGQLADTYHSARGSLDGGSGAALPVGADLPVWFDNLPASLGGTGSIGWGAAADRDAWFTGIGTDVASVSMMAYERDTDALIVSAVAGEAALFPGELRVGLNEEVGTTWATIDELFDMAETLEGLGYTVDLHSYAEIRGQLPP